MIVISPDHFPYGLEESGTWGNVVNHLAELYGVEDYNHIVRDHSVLILWSGCLEGQNITVDEPAYSLDILPTLLNLFGLEYDSRLMAGRDILSDEPGLVIFSNYSFLTDQGAYDSTTDAFTMFDGSEPDPDYVAERVAEVQNRVASSASILDWDYYRVVVGSE